MLVASVGGSSFEIEWEKIREWQPLLNSAHSIGLSQNGCEKVHVELNGCKRWVAFRRETNGVVYEVAGYQETVGSITRGNTIIGGSNRKTLLWLHPSGHVYVGDQPGG